MHAISADLAVQRSVLRELNIDRAYLSGLLVREPPTELAVYCKVCPVRNSTCFPKTAFQLGWEHHLIECPNQVALPFEPGEVVHFPAAICAVCPLRERCTSSQHGWSVTIHPDAALLSMPWPILGDGKDGGRAIAACAKTYLTCAAARWFIACI